MDHLNSTLRLSESRYKSTDNGRYERATEHDTKVKMPVGAKILQVHVVVLIIGTWASFPLARAIRLFIFIDKKVDFRRNRARMTHISI